MSDAPRSDPPPASAPAPAWVGLVRELFIVAALVGGAVVFSETGHPDLAATALGGALTWIVPGHRRLPPGAPLAVGLVTGAVASALGIGGAS